MTVAEIMRTMPDTDRQALMAAFEEGIAFYVEYVSGRFIGVNIDNAPHLKVEQASGQFREGIIHHSV